MCTVVFIPGEKVNFFGTLRDENPQRPRAHGPILKESNNVKFISPVDALSGGTWVGANELGSVIILLNGGFENHARKNPYRKSRGLIVTELLSSDVPVIEWNLMDMEDIEPYTLIVWTDKKLFQLVWDGKKRQRFLLDSTKPQIWSSATLYDIITRNHREELFQNWVAMDPPVSKISLLKFFKLFNDAENGFLINRGGKIKTLSYTFIESGFSSNCVMHYYDLTEYTYQMENINLKTAVNDANFLFNLKNDN